MLPQSVVDAGLYFSEWSSCLTGKYQRDQLYRFGKFDDCHRQWQDLTQIVSAKFMNDEDEARRIVQQTYHYQRTNISPTIGIIWEAKETPGWD
jgi:Protein of unknown function (DUF3128)